MTIKVNRSVEVVVPPREPHFVGDGFRVHNFMPSAYRLDMERMDPFIVMDYNSKHYFEPSDHQRGVGVHPHRGFETVTIAYKGRIAHHDSSGGGGIIGEGDVQWMTAGAGILHKEYHEESFSKKGGIFQMVQLWVNLPAASRMTQPTYQGIKKSEMPALPLPGGGTARLIAGSFMGAIGPANTHSPMHVLNLELNADEEVALSLPSDYNTALLIIEGSLVINGTVKAAVDHFVLMDNDGESFAIKANENAVVLVLSGKPLKEPIVAHGPFVMNTREQIIQAYQDFNASKFGVLK